MEHATGLSLKDLQALARSVLDKRKFIVVSNREPYEHVHDGGTIKMRKPTGGLTTALDPVMQAVGGTWVAWGSGSADRETVDDHHRLHVPPGKPKYSLRRVWLDEEEKEKFYEGHVNQTLWPLCHTQTDKVRFIRNEWDTYQLINRRFAEAVKEEQAGMPSIVWFQDYHFASAPSILRDVAGEESGQLLITHFWHIPWPPWEIFRQHPQRRAILEGLLGCDLIGMHIDLYCLNFLTCVMREFNLPVDMEKQQVVVGNRTVRVKSLPISIDAYAFEKLARSKRAERIMSSFRSMHNLQGKLIGIGVERSDYTKGILERLHAIELLFEKYPQWCEQVTFIQISSPSRVGIQAYKLFRHEVQSAVNRVNEHFRTETWLPILHLRTAQSPVKLAALYRLADIAIVSSLQDGMNLVAKEYIASQVDEQGVLVLSEFAGVAEEMPQTISINPYDVEGFAHAIHQALKLPREERRTRMIQLRNHLFTHTIYDWMAEVFREMEKLDNGKSQGGITVLQPALDHLDEIEEKIGKDRHIVLFCDYDGVLTPIAPRPEEARLDEHMRNILIKLRDSARVHVNIISGRALDDLIELVSVERLTYAGNHGLEICGPRIQRIHPGAEDIAEAIQELYEDLRNALQDFAGVIVENKQLGISVHYRLAEPTQVPDVLTIFHQLVEDHNDKNILRITTGKKILEVRPNLEWNKGKAVLWFLSSLHGSSWQKEVIPIYLGDDETDEDAFQELRESGIMIRVGSPDETDTAAKYVLENTDDVSMFLDWLIRIT